MTITKDKLDETLRVEEIDNVGVVKLDDWKDTPVHETAKQLLPGAKSIIVLALEVFSEVVKYLTSQRKVGEVAMHDLYNRNLEMVNGHLDWETYKLVKRLHRYGYKGLALTATGAPYDSRFIEPVLSYGKVAELAGLGTKGWHSMLLTPDFGTRIRLACVVTDASLPPTAATKIYYPCPDCGGACIKICPVSAIKQPKEEESDNIDKFACCNYLISAGGCSQCLKICPAGRL